MDRLFPGNTLVMDKNLEGFRLTLANRPGAHARKMFKLRLHLSHEIMIF